MLLDIKGLTKQYVRGGAAFIALDNACLSLSEGEFLTISGKSGSGKSTLLNLIAGLMRPTAGSVEYSGKNIFAFTDAEASRYRNASIGYVPQGLSALANLTVLDNVRLPFFLFKKEGDAGEKAILLLEQTGIRHLAGVYPRQLSGGELRRVSIARALINSPSLLIADEPTGDLDVKTTAGIMSLFSEIAQGGTGVVVVTHDPDTAHYGTRYFVMDAGRLNEAG